MPLASLIARQRRGPAILQQRSRTALVVDRTAPLGGWNARDPLAEMSPLDARTLDNLFPGFGRLRLRRGFASHATGVGSAAVDTLLTFNDGSTEKLIAASATNVYDATAAGAASSLIGSQTSGRWQGAMMNGKLAMLNGADTPLEIDNTPSASTLSITGVTSSTLKGILVHKSRSYFWSGANQSFWYSAVNALGGSLTEFDLSRVLNLGGELVQCLTWTRDGGAGPDDFFVALMSSGEAVVYAGSNPGDADAWSLVGVYTIGEPLSIRGAAKVGGDVVIATKGGYQSLANAAAEPGGRIDNKIIKAVTDQVALTGSGFGWQALLYQEGSMLIFNYPRTSANQYGQHVVNLETGAWCRFLGQNGGAWTIYNGKPYFGGSGGIVYVADTGNGDAGAAINWELVSPWDYLNARGVRKALKQIRPVLSTDGQISFSADIAADFRAHGAQGGTIMLGRAAGGTQWNAGQWNSFQWAGSAGTVDAPWIIREREGFAFSLRMKGATLGKSLEIDSVGYAIQGAGVM